MTRLLPVTHLRRRCQPFHCNSRSSGQVDSQQPFDCVRTIYGATGGNRWIFEFTVTPQKIALLKSCPQSRPLGSHLLERHQQTSPDFFGALHDLLDQSAGQVSEGTWALVLLGHVLVSSTAA